MSMAKQRLIIPRCVGKLFIIPDCYLEYSPPLHEIIDYSGSPKNSDILAPFSRCCCPQNWPDRTDSWACTDRLYRPFEMGIAGLWDGEDNRLTCDTGYSRPYVFDIPLFWKAIKSPWSLAFFWFLWESQWPKNLKLKMTVICTHLWSLSWHRENVYDKSVIGCALKNR